MALNGLVLYLRRAVPYFSRSAVTGAQSDEPIRYDDFSPISGLIQEAEASWASADPAAQAEVTRCAGVVECVCTHSSARLPLGWSHPALLLQGHERPLVFQP